MKRRKAVIITAILAALAASGTPSLGDPRVADLVQAGKIRVALFPPQYVQDPASGELRPFAAGVISMELARGLTRRLGVEVQLVGQPTPPKAVECVKTAACDVVIVGIEPSRAAEVDFSRQSFSSITPIWCRPALRSTASPTWTGPGFASPWCAITPRPSR